MFILFIFLIIGFLVSEDSQNLVNDTFLDELFMEASNFWSNYQHPCWFNMKNCLIVWDFSDYEVFELQLEFNETFRIEWNNMLKNY